MDPLHLLREQARKSVGELMAHVLDAEAIVRQGSRRPAIVGAALGVELPNDRNGSAWSFGAGKSAFGQRCRVRREAKQGARAYRPLCRRTDRMRGHFYGQVLSLTFSPGVLRIPGEIRLWLIRRLGDHLV